MRSLGSTRARLAALLLAGAALTATPAHASPASMSGTITDAETGQPVGGVCVLVWKEEGDFAWEQYPQVCTEEDGTWSKTGLEPGGVYYVEAAGAGYVKQYAYGQDHSWGATRWTLGDGDSATVDLAMEPGGTIEGTVTDAATGLPLDGICVSAQSIDHWASSCTNEDGTYALGGLRAADDWVVSFSDWRSGRYNSEYAYDATDFDAATRFTVRAGEVTTVDEDLTESAAITGIVTNAAGEPAGGVCVMAVSAPTALDASGFACTDYDGTYRMQMSTAGTYHLSVEDESGAHARTWAPGTTDPTASVPVTVVAGQETTGGDIALQPAGYVSGIVTSAATGEPIAGVCASAVRVSDSQWVRTGGPDICSDETGRYTLGGLSSGDVKVVLYPPDRDLLMHW